MKTITIRGWWLVLAVALGFLSSSAHAQTFTVNNLVVNGTAGLGSAVTISGGTATFTVAPVKVRYVNATFSIDDSSGAGVSNLGFQSNTVSQWIVNKDASQNFNITRFVGGVVQDNPISIANATGNVTMADALSVTGAITPAQVAGIVGTTTNNNAAVGAWGEYRTNATATNVATTGTNLNVASLVSLPAGDWDIEGTCTFNIGATTNTTQMICGIGLTSATFQGLNLGTRFKQVYSTGLVGAFSEEYPTPMVRVSLSVATTIFLVAESNFTVSGMTIDGFIRARRVR